ncbi:MAG: RtcB family protein [Chloroflexi bacterium AL-W]|nr:RtcB family protein [Chloroflexi bacterium AL-N1]NOK68436.1 RtcB family protein [Chloroflexi bacterium AL-N10]NOK74082.1 RtcB family protein [Chloroflexi bacterium AL-N5]NOK83049.1 RtcB family protein [Chloroflexi bacterium AL-W]NOK90572.1 RtcB family protein [Chloroflexi bacterium AL-N15]
MKVQKLIAHWKGDKRYTNIARRAAVLKKSGHDAEAIMATITVEFGEPAQLARLRDTPQPFRVYGEVGADIETHAFEQLKLALRIPVAVQGALMPDAHPGYALPIGGVFAAHRAVAPAMVGVDIGCRMHLTIFEEAPETFMRHRTPLFADLQAVTIFGLGARRSRAADHAILDDDRWGLTSQTQGLRAQAETQLGTSGSGNHFAELVIGERVDIPTTIPNKQTTQPDTAPGHIPHRFCGLLTHSGSRGVGFAIANRYMRLAAQETARHAKVPKMYEWLDLDTESGQEYWEAMELAGAFAQANHEVIHASFARQSRLRPLQVIQNHHNFAWRKGDLVIHRKGATPAEEGRLGVIPGSMGTSSYIVAGCGIPEALESAAHGAGRRSSREVARNSISMRDVRAFLEQQDIIVEGLSVDEAPQAYKDIEHVLRLQVEAGLVQPLARMRPVAVIMAGEADDD